MSRLLNLIGGVLLCGVWLCALPAIAEVREVHVDERTDVEQGKSFGAAGPYERITGTVVFADLPGLPANRLVHDIELAPRNRQGKVESTAEFYILKPRNPAKGNGTLLCEVPNRGGKGMVGVFDLAPGSLHPGTAAGDLGDAYLLEQGYTLLWLGWQVDAPLHAELLHLKAPVAKNPDGSRIRGLVRSDFVLDQDARSASLADAGHQAFLTVDLDDPAARLSVRERVDDPRQFVPRDEWQFAHDENGRPVPDAAAVYMRSGFTKGKIYEVLYTSQDPPVTGLGFAATRDFISFLKYGGPETLLADQKNYMKRAIGFGISQSGRFLRDFLYQGFNADEQGRRVFDGVWAHVGGAGRGNFNYRFAQASRDARPFLNFFYPVDIFPFTDAPETDDVNGQTGGLLDKTRQQNVTPRIFLTNGSYEYWGRAAALIHTSVDGKADVAPEPYTRIYFIAGTQHTPGHVPPPASDTAFEGNPNNYRFALRALLADFQAWVKDDVEPPPSIYPLLAKGELQTFLLANFPRIPDVHTPVRPHEAYRVDYGPDFVSRGIEVEPPSVGRPFALLVPQVNADGIDVSGIRLPEIQVPLGTYTGWNYRSKKIGASDEMASFVGSFFPFPPNQAARRSRHDPRVSIAERYASKDEYLNCIQVAAQQLVQQRFMLPQDVAAAVEHAREEWQWAVR